MRVRLSLRDARPADSGTARTKQHESNNEGYNAIYQRVAVLYKLYWSAFYAIIYGDAIRF